MIPPGISAAALQDMYVKSETPCTAASVHVWCLDVTDKVISNHLTSLEPNDTCKETYYVLFLITQVENDIALTLCTNRNV